MRDGFILIDTQKKSINGSDTIAQGDGRHLPPTHPKNMLRCAERPNTSNILGSEFGCYGFAPINESRLHDLDYFENA